MHRFWTIDGGELLVIDLTRWGLVFPIVMFMFSGVAYGDELCEVPYTNLKDLVMAIQADDRFTADLPDNGHSMMFSDDESHQRITFFLPTHKAYPGAVCAETYKKDGYYRVRFQLVCHANRETCDEVDKFYRDLSNSMKRTIASRSDGP